MHILPLLGNPNNLCVIIGFIESPGNNFYSAIAATCDYGVHRENMEPVIIDIETQATFLDIGDPTTEPKVFRTDQDPSCNVIISHTINLGYDLKIYAYNICTGEKMMDS